MKKLGFVLVILMAVTLVFTGCGGGGSSSGTKVLRVEIFDRGSDGGRSLAYDNAWTDWVKEKVLKDLGFEVEFVPVGRWSEDTDITNLLAAGTAPDLCYTYNTGMINSFGQQGGILDLTPYIDRFLPDMKKLLGADPAFPGVDLIYRDKNPVTNKQFSVTSYVVNNARRAVFIRKDWLDKLGLPLPKNLDEFEAALIAFRDQDPGGVGRNRVIPLLTEADVRWQLGNFMLPFIGNGLNPKDEWINGPWYDRPVLLPGYKEGARLMNKWFNEGLIYRDFPLLRDGNNDGDALRMGGTVGAFSQNWDYPFRNDYAIQTTLEQNVPGAVFYPVVLEGPNGVIFNDVSDKPGLRIFIPASSKNYEEALQYLNWLCIYDNLHFLQVGNEGVNHVKENGVPRIQQMPAGHAWFQNSPNNIDMTMPVNGIEMMDPDLSGRVTALSFTGIDPAIVVETIRTATVNGFVRTIYQANLVKYGEYSMVLELKANEILTQSIRARAADFDRIWDAGIRDYLQSGGQEVIDERAAAWAAGH